MSGEDAHLEAAFEDAISGSFEEVAEPPEHDPSWCWACGTSLDDGVWENKYGDPICWVCDENENDD
jgi:hypothetical protein